MVSSIKLAIIKEEACVGCTKCIEACPVDAIIGASQLMHSVLSHECIGCGLCVEPCPMDCIEIVQIPSENNSMKRHELAALARSKHIAKRNRKILEYLPALPNAKDANHRNKILNEIELAKERVNARRHLLDRV